jgi:glucose-1-phosphate adenylyltransferase
MKERRHSEHIPHSLIEHVRKGCTISPLQPDQFVTVVPPRMSDNKVSFEGTADAVYQNLELLDIRRPTLVTVFGADHIYRMDVAQMVRFHREREADISVAACPVPIDETPAFGIVEVDDEGRIRGFEEKPDHGKPMPSDPARALASMGNYLFDARVLKDVLEEVHARGEADFGHHVLPRLLDSHRLYAYDFMDNHVPGVKPYEEAGYWRDVGTLDAYFEAHTDVLGMEPRLDLFNPQWPIYSSHYQRPAE